MAELRIQAATAALSWGELLLDLSLIGVAVLVVISIIITFAIAGGWSPVKEEHPLSGNPQDG